MTAARRRRWSLPAAATSLAAAAAVSATAVAGVAAAQSLQLSASTLLLVAGAGDAVTAVEEALGLSPEGVDGGRGLEPATAEVVDATAAPPASATLGLTGAAPAPDGLAGSSDRSAPSGRSGGPGGRGAAGGPGASDAPTASPTLEAIAECESDGDPTAVSADGEYRGKYQFSRTTWEAVGGTGDPAAAPEAVQDRLAARLLAESGTSAWPSCG